MLECRQPKICSLDCPEDALTTGQEILCSKVIASMVALLHKTGQSNFSFPLAAEKISHMNHTRLWREK
jgi:hypothetical protein